MKIYPQILCRLFALKYGGKCSALSLYDPHTEESTGFCLGICPRGREARVVSYRMPSFMHDRRCDGKHSIIVVLVL